MLRFINNFLCGFAFCFMLGSLFLWTVVNPKRLLNSTAPEEQFRVAVSWVEDLQHGDAPLNLAIDPDKPNPYARYLTFARWVPESPEDESICYCGNCGAPVERTDKYCYECGAKFSTVFATVSMGRPDAAP